MARRARKPEPHPFEQFKETMRRLVTVTKEQLNEQLKEHDRTNPKQRPGRKPKAHRK